MFLHFVERDFHIKSKNLHKELVIYIIKLNGFYVGFDWKID